MRGIRAPKAMTVTSRPNPFAGIVEMICRNPIEPSGETVLSVIAAIAGRTESTKRKKGRRQVHEAVVAHDDELRQEREQALQSQRDPAVRRGAEPPEKLADGVAVGLDRPSLITTTIPVPACSRTARTPSATAPKRLVEPPFVCCRVIPRC